jgi:hypothetical protein
MLERLDRVTIALPGGDVTIPWDTRQALMGRLQHVGERSGICSRFGAVGASRPIQLSQRQLLALQRVLVTWSDDGMPAELNDLLTALSDEVANSD